MGLQLNPQFLNPTMTNTFKTTLSVDELMQITGGSRTDKKTCEDAGMKWSKDAGTEKDGLGRCRA